MWIHRAYQYFSLRVEGWLINAYSALVCVLTLVLVVVVIIPRYYRLTYKQPDYIEVAFSAVIALMRLLSPCMLSRPSCTFCYCHLASYHWLYKALITEAENVVIWNIDNPTRKASRLIIGE